MSKDRTVERVTRGLLLPSNYVIEQESLAYHDGAGKRTAHLDWITPNRNLKRDVEALIRHLEEYLDGTTEDVDSGAHPLAHVRTRAGIILDVEKCRKDKE